MAYINNTPIVIPFAPDCQAPIDIRLEVATFADLGNIVSGHRYPGMTVFVIDEDEHYKLLSDLSSWILLSDIAETPTGEHCISSALGVNTCVVDATLEILSTSDALDHDIIAASTGDGVRKFGVSNTVNSATTGVKVTVVGDTPADTAVINPSGDSYTTGNLAVGKTVATAPLDVEGEIKAGSLTATGALTGASISVTGDIEAGGDAVIDGDASVGSLSSDTSISAVSNATIGGTLSVSGDSSLADITAEAAHFTGAIVADLGMVIGGDLDVLGSFSSDRIITTASGIRISGSLDVASNTHITGVMTATDGIVAGTSGAPATSTFIGNVSVTEDLQTSGSLTSGAILNANAGIAVTGNVNTTGNVNAPNLFQKSDFVDEDVPGVDQSGKPVKLNAAGLVDESLIRISAMVPIGSFTPDASDEYPATTPGMNPGSFWTIEGVDPTAGYTFVDGSLTGDTIYNGDLLLFIEYIDGINDTFISYEGGIDPNLYYRIDGSNPISADFQANSKKLVSVADGTAVTDAATVGQLNAKLAKAGDTMTGALAMTDDGAGVPDITFAGVGGQNQAGTRVTGADETSRVFEMILFATDGTTTDHNLSLHGDGTAKVDGGNVWHTGATTLDAGGVAISNVADGVQVTDAASLGQTTALINAVDKGDVGLGNVDDTSDADKPISTAQQAAFDGIDNAIVPVGGIVMFSGDITTLNANWALCDGSGTPATPDLRGMFIIGGDGTTNGTTGGSRDAIVVDHTHTAAASSTFTGTALAAHGHTVSATSSFSGAIQLPSLELQWVHTAIVPILLGHHYQLTRTFMINHTKLAMIQVMRMLICSIQTETLILRLYPLVLQTEQLQ